MLAIDDKSNIQHRDFRVYPNPATKIVHIEGDFKQWELFDISGKLLQSGKHNQVDVSEYSPGLYFLKLDAYPVKILIQ
jgi:hypothetical protein